MGKMEPFVYDHDDEPEVFLLSCEDVDIEATGKKKAKNYWAQSDATSYNLRGKKYLEDRVKIPSKDAAFDVVSVQIFKSNSRVYHVAENMASLKDYLSNYPDEFFFITARILPTKANHFVVTIARRVLPEGEDEPFDKALDSYIEGDDEYRNMRLKYIAKISDSPWLVQRIVKGLGGERPAILGKGYLKQQHYRGPNYYEVNVDVGSSLIASQIAGSVTGFASSVKVGECFLIEGQEEDKLPERAVYTVDLVNIQFKLCSIALNQEDETFFNENPYGTVHRI